MSPARSPLRMAAAALMLATASLPARAAEPARQPTIIVSGTGEQSLRPDIAMISLGVGTMAETAGKALADNSDAMTKVFAGLKEAGIAETDMQTSGLSINPQYAYPDRNNDGQGDQAELVGYQVVNQLTVRLKDIAKVGETLDLAVGLGINQAAGIQFLNTDTKAATAEARKRAVADAMAKAKALADAAGVTLGPVIEMSENQSQPMPMAMQAEMTMKAAPTPIAPGENVIQVNVNMIFAIAP